MNKITILLIASAAVLATSCGQKDKSSGIESGAQLEAAIEVGSDSTKVINIDANPVIELASIDQMPDNGKLTVIDFNATWCGPCKRFAPSFHATAEMLANDANFVSVDVDKFPELAQKYGVNGIPHVAFVQPDGTVDSAVGTDQLADFTNLVKAHLAK